MNFNCVRIVLKSFESRINRQFLLDCKSVGDAFGGSNPPSSTKSLESLVNRAFQGFLLYKISLFFALVLNIHSMKKCLKVLQNAC